MPDATSAITYLTRRDVRWTRVADGLQLYTAQVDGAHWSIREGRKNEPRYSLFVDGKPIVSFDAWPAAWGREPKG